MDILIIICFFCSLCSIFPVWFTAKNATKFNNVIIRFLLAAFTPVAADLFTIGLFDIYISSFFATMWSSSLWVILELINNYNKKVAKKGDQKSKPAEHSQPSVLPSPSPSPAPPPPAPAQPKPVPSVSSPSAPPANSQKPQEEVCYSRYYSPHSQFSNEAMYSNKKTSSESSLISDELVESYKRGYPQKAKSFIDEWNEKYSNKALAKQDKKQTTPQPQKVKVKPVKRK